MALRMYSAIVFGMIGLVCICRIKKVIGTVDEDRLSKVLGGEPADCRLQLGLLRCRHELGRMVCCMLTLRSTFSSSFLTLLQGVWLVVAVPGRLIK